MKKQENNFTSKRNSDNNQDRNTAIIERSRNLKSSRRSNGSSSQVSVKSSNSAAHYRKAKVISIIVLATSLATFVVSLLPTTILIKFVISTSAIVASTVCASKVGHFKSLALICVTSIILSGLGLTQIGVNFIADWYQRDKLEKRLREELNTKESVSTEDILNREIDVKIGKFNHEVSQYGISSTSLAVEVDNKTDEKGSYVLQVAAIGEDEEEIAREYVYVNGIEGGEVKKYESFTYVSDESLDKVIDAEFKVVDISKL